MIAYKMMNNDGNVKININNPSKDIIKKAVEVLTSGGVIVAPTETRYGLIARGDIESVLDRLYQIKRRPAFMPTAVFAGSYEDIWKLGMKNKNAELLAHKFLPGPLTLVLKSIVLLPKQVISDNKVGVRFSTSRVIDGLVKSVDFPLTATSANISGEQDCSIINEIIALFDKKVDFYIDGGCLDLLPSTVVDCTEDSIKILREGAISAEEIKKVLSGE